MKKILVADPDEVLATVYSEELAEEGYMVTSCSDPVSLMNVIASERPDLILVDMQMVLDPGEGFDREIENYLPTAPLIFYTSSLGYKPVKESIPSERFITKTRNLMSLKSRVIAALSGQPTEKTIQMPLLIEQMAFRWLND